ncbi:MAG: hypothetical protein IJV31_10335 [Clostridia bacterium]|nr:hypothetical protein [Clostridia bacterium]
MVNNIVNINNEPIIKTIQVSENGAIVNLVRKGQKIIVEVVSKNGAKTRKEVSEDQVQFLFSDIENLEVNETFRGAIITLIKRLDKEKDKPINLPLPNRNLKTAISDLVDRCSEWEKSKKIKINTIFNENGEIQVQIFKRNTSESINKKYLISNEKIHSLSAKDRQRLLYVINGIGSVVSKESEENIDLIDEEVIFKKIQDKVNEFCENLAVDENREEK